MGEIEHGTTNAAFARCRRNTPGGACDPCKRAHNRWRREHRSKNAESYAREQRLAKGQSKALWRLAHTYPAVFRALVSEELAKLDERQDEVA